MQSSRSTVPLVDGSAKDIPGKFNEAHIGGESRAWHLLQALCIKKFPMCSCSRSYSVVVLQLKFVHIHSSCVWEPMALQDTTVDEGVVVSIRVLPIAFAARMNIGPYHQWAVTTMSHFTDADVDDVPATYSSHFGSSSWMVKDLPTSDVKRAFYQGSTCNLLGSLAQWSRVIFRWTVRHKQLAILLTCQPHWSNHQLAVWKEMLIYGVFSIINKGYRLAFSCFSGISSEVAANFIW